MKKKILIRLFILVVTFGLTAPMVLADHQTFDLDKAIQQGDHKALADHYRAEAKKYKEIAEMHDKMQKSYKKTHVHHKGTENTLATHCGNLKFQALKMAEQYEALAKEEEGMTK